MRLTTRFTVAILAHAFITVSLLAALNYRVFEAAGLPGAADRFRLYTLNLANDLAAATNGVRADVLALSAAEATQALVRAGRAGGIDPQDGRTLAERRAEVAARCADRLAAAPSYRTCRVIAVAGGDLVRVERSDGNVRVAGDADLQQSTAGDGELIRQTLLKAAGDVFVSPVEPGPAPQPDAAPTPRLSVAAAVPADGGPFAIVVITLDLSDAFARITAAAVPPRPALLAQLPRRAMLVVDERGDYLLHPEPGRALRPAQAEAPRLQDDFPGLSEEALKLDEFGPLIMHDRTGARFVVGLTQVRLAGARLVAVVQAVPFTAAYSAVRTVFTTTVIGLIVAVITAIVVAILLARTLSRPIVQMTEAVTAFGRDTPMAAPTEAAGEIGILARTFSQMAAEVSDKTAAIRRSAEILDLIVTRMADAVLLVDERAAIIFANAAARELLGPGAGADWHAWTQTYEVFQADGHTPLSPEQWPVTRAVRGDRIDTFHMALRRRSADRMIHVIVSARPFEAAGPAAKGAVLVFRDVSDWTETERLMRESQKMEAIGQLTGGIAHDFNNILTVITGTIDILSAGVADRPPLANIARMIDEAAARGADLTRQLLAFARRQPLEPRVTDINALIVETARLLRPALGEQIEIEAMLEDAAWHAMIDKTQLSTALLNLALNARDAMPEGGKLTLETANVILDEAYAQANPDVIPGPYVMVAVSDTGSGIPAALHEKVFEPFFTTKQVGRGTGLGLSMVYGFVRQSGGHIKIYSEEGHGTAIKLYLPRSRDGLSPPETVPLPPPQGGHETILVVEDDALVRNYVIAQITSLGYQAIAATNGAEALALMDRGATFDLLFTDVVMPGGLNGRQLADEVTRRRPGTAVLYTSGYTENAILHHGRLDADVALLNKPYRKLDLARKIREALGAGKRGSEPAAKP
jgi:signal transduction histidine kinase